MEINIPAERSDGRVAGFFATNPTTGDIFLMHDGGIGGGRPGIGKEAFLHFITDELQPVNSGRSVRYGLPIGALSDPNLAGLIWRFVKKVEAFKGAASAGTVTAVHDDDGPGGANYSPEFWGRKQGERSSKFDYISYHGMIVDQLKLEREKTLHSSEVIGKDRYVDLFVSRGSRRVEIYEVKTSSGRQALYTAIGQLMVHGQDGASRILIAPCADELPADCGNALAALQITLRHYHIRGNGMRARVEFVAS